MIEILSLICYFFVASSADSVKRPRGVPLSMMSLYPTQGTFTCFDGSLTIPFDHINDDYCDCTSDGSDEPGTSACPNGIFHCTNRGHKSFFIPSSRVNDGICDCCDGSDEYLLGVSCDNNCYELGQVAREEEAKKLAMFKEGSKIRKELCTKGTQMKREKQLRLLELKKEQTEAELLKFEKEMAKEGIEAQEKAALDAHQEWEDEQQKKFRLAENMKNEEKAKQIFKEMDANGDGLLQREEIATFKFLDRDKNGDVSEDEIKMMMGEDEPMSFETFFVHGWPYLKQIFATDVLKEGEDNKIQVDEHSLDPLDKSASLGGTDEQMFGEGEDEEDHDEPNPLEDIETSQRYPLPSDDFKIEYDKELQSLIHEANAARSEYDNAVRNLRDIEREIQQHEDILNRDFGPEEEFAYLVGECFEYTDREYTYKLCPFDRVTQQPKDGGSETSLGSWDNWVDNKYKEMHYLGGVSCWNGPARNAKVKFLCNVRTEIVSVSEPNRCEYLLEFNTPAVCLFKEIEEARDHHEEL